MTTKTNNHEQKLSPQMKMLMMTINTSKDDDEHKQSSTKAIPTNEDANAIGKPANQSLTSSVAVVSAVLETMKSNRVLLTRTDRVVGTHDIPHFSTQVAAAVPQAAPLPCSALRGCT